MSMYQEQFDNDFPAWRRPAPRARRLTMALYAWQEPGWVFLLAILAATPFVIAAGLSPALLSLSPTVDMIAPIADARAIAAGNIDVQAQNEPFFLFLLMAADVFADAPGRIHLIAKVLSTVMIVYPLAYFCAARFPVMQTVFLSGAVAAYVCAPFAAVQELALAIYLVLSIALVCAPADEARDRARFEGIICGGLLFALWTLSPIFFLAGVLALSACPFLTGRAGLDRYIAALGAGVVFAIAAEIMAPGLTVERANAASGVVTAGAQAFANGGSGWGLAGVGVATTIIIFASAIFGGREHARGWAAGAVYLLASFAAARIAGAQTMPLFAVAAGMASLSVASPFYDGVFRNHDRASIAIAASAAVLTLFWTAAIGAHGVGQFVLQYKVAAEASEDMRTRLALVQPGGPTIARWIEEGRFSTPEARELFALAPIDQSTMLLEAAEKARSLADQGVEVAILTGADTACVIAEKRKCQADGRAAAGAANVVFVPRLDLDAKTAEVKGRSEALLYTDFKLTQRTAFWEVWVRRGITAPADLTSFGEGL
ncbi:MAG: hypothetical protein AAFR21_01385 [Pseudomonadota bacterium]